jgi:hypothetical protein
VKILIVAAYFPPQNSIASLRPYSWAKWWSKAGHKVTILTTVKVIRENDFILDCSGFEIISLPVPVISNFPSYRNTVVAAHNKKTVSGKLLSMVKRYYSLFSQKTGCFYTCRFPDFHDLWAKNAFVKVRELSFDMIISTGGPYSVHRIGLAMKKKYPKTKWIIDWRDLWTHNHLFKGLGIFWFYEKYLEKKFHDTANLITTVSEPLADILRSMTKTRTEVIYNGYEPDDYDNIKQKARKENGAFTIVYTGTIYRSFQDPSSLFEAVSNLKKNNSITKTDIKIIFAGVNTDIKDIAEYYDISEFYSYLGFLSREDALQLQYDADAVLFLEYNNPAVQGVLTGKLFEYLYIAREIVAVGINGNTTADRLINDTQTGFCFGTDVKKIEQYLITKINNKAESSYLEKNGELIQKFNRKNQAMKILENV